MPAWTVISFRSFENATTWSSCRMSICRARSVAVCPPWLKRPPPIDTGPGCDRTASTISPIVVGTRTLSTGTGLICVTSLTIAALRANAGDWTAQAASSEARSSLRKQRPQSISRHRQDEDNDRQRQAFDTAGEAARSEQVVRERDDGETEHGDLQEDRCPVRAVAGVDPEPDEDERDRRRGVNGHQRRAGLWSTGRAVLQAAEDQRERGEKSQELRLRSRHRSDLVESHQGVVRGISILQQPRSVGREPGGHEDLLELLQRYEVPDLGGVRAPGKLQPAVEDVVSERHEMVHRRIGHVVIPDDQGTAALHGSVTGADEPVSSLRWSVVEADVDRQDVDPFFRECQWVVGAQREEASNLEQVAAFHDIVRLVRRLVRVNEDRRLGELELLAQAIVVAPCRSDLRVTAEPLPPLEQGDRLVAHDPFLLAEGRKGVSNLPQVRLDRGKLGQNGLVDLPVGELRPGDTRDQIVKVLLRVEIEDVLQEQEELLTEPRIEVDLPEVAVLGCKAEAGVSGREGRHGSGDEKVEHLTPRHRCRPHQ